MTTNFARALAALAIALPVTAHAQNFTGMQNDFELIGALNMMAGTFGQACQMGDQNSCMNYQYVQNVGGYLYNTSEGCLQGYQDACYAYSQAINQFSMDYQQFTMLAGGGNGGMGMAGGINPLGATHEERMDNIAAWGANTLAQGDANSALLDQRHEQFMSTLTGE